MTTVTPVPERVAAAIKVNPDTGCWEWQLTIDRDGYGRIKIGGRYGRMRIAHRITYVMFVGPIPEGFQIDHLCRVRSCVNPDHLEAVTAMVNTMRSLSPSSLNAKKTHCKRGHPFSGSNLGINPNGSRRCKACARVIQRRSVERRRSAA